MTELQQLFVVRSEPIGVPQTEHYASPWRTARLVTSGQANFIRVSVLMG
jgi:hypothetical protein